MQVLHVSSRIRYIDARQQYNLLGKERKNGMNCLKTDFKSALVQWLLSVQQLFQVACQHLKLIREQERMLGRDKWFGNGLIKCLDGYPHVNGFCRSHHGKSFSQLLIKLENTCT